MYICTRIYVLSAEGVAIRDDEEDEMDFRANLEVLGRHEVCATLAMYMYLCACM